jgi:hypothetical protein
MYGNTNAWLIIKSPTITAYLRQEAQLLLGWPTLWRQINHLVGEGHRVKVGVRQTTAIMEPSLTGEMPHTILTFVTLK